MTMEFGIFHEFPKRPGTTEDEVFAQGFEVVDRAEEWGLDAIWLAELHFSGRSVLSAPMTIASAIAARTERAKIGIAVQVLPLVNPLRMAEETATVDQISRGRLIFGVGRSGFARTYETYGVPYAESRERFAETLDIILGAWTQENFSYEGKWHSYKDVNLVPRPYQQPHPEVRVAANTPDTFPTLGEQGYPLFAAVRLGTLSELGPNLKAYRRAWKAAGHPGEGRVFLRLPIYIGETPEEALEEPRQSIMSFYQSLGAQLHDSAGLAGARAVEQRAERGARLQNVSYEEALREKVVVGTPAMVVDRIRQIRDELGIDGILAELNCGGLIPHDRVMRSLRLLCQEVMPAFNGEAIGSRQ